jgi:hypothetical protein
MNVFDYNQDGKIDIQDIFDLVYSLMKEQKKNKLLSGNDKKFNVLNNIRFVLGSDAYKRYEPLLNQSIDFIYNKLIKSKIFKCCKKK